MSNYGHNILKSPSKCHSFVRKTFVFVSVWLFLNSVLKPRELDLSTTFTLNALVIDLFPDVKAYFFGLQCPKEVFDDYQ